ncbi:hypothetical protein JOD54_005706 [Actinokineospora baliensis]|uniref:hypothetical protein n=1 Tax=Actinokineospora baliensis TaxID=547056 RepID=UPI0019571699|nr:hypothetical protein [Actinokineospora baliensis]MBM7775502.1 hypothetical protein [Actinokineospora baliensis]
MKDLARWVLLAFVYFVVVTPIGVVGRLLSDPLHRRPDRRADTYWTWLGESDGGAPLVRATTTVAAGPGR